MGGVTTSGRIVETEAYLGPEDAASHAAFRPSSHALFYGEGGHAYVFRIYGVHFCLNAITGGVGEPGCVLVRAIAPLVGVHVMARRRGLRRDSRELTNGPGKLTQALGITARDNGVDLTRGRLVIERAANAIDGTIVSGPRIGITRATELPLRFWIAGNRYVSRGRAPETAPEDHEKSNTWARES